MVNHEKKKKTAVADCFKCGKENVECIPFSFIDDWVEFTVFLCQNCTGLAKQYIFEAKASYNCPVCGSAICTICGELHESDDHPLMMLQISENKQNCPECGKKGKKSKRWNQYPQNYVCRNPGCTLYGWNAETGGATGSFHKELDFERMTGYKLPFTYRFKKWLMRPLRAIMTEWRWKKAIKRDPYLLDSYLMYKSLINEQKQKKREKKRGND